MSAIHFVAEGRASRCANAGEATVHMDLGSYRARLEGHARYLGLSREDAEDAAQLTLIRSHRVEWDGRDPYSYLIKVLTNIVRDRARRKRPTTASLDTLTEAGDPIVDLIPHPVEDEPLIPDEMREKVMALLALLPPAQQRAIGLKLSNVRDREASMQLGLGLATYRTHVWRARVSMRRLLASLN